MPERLKKASLCEAVHADHHHRRSVLRGANFSTRSIGIFARNGAYRCHSSSQHFCPHCFARLVCRTSSVQGRSKHPLLVTGICAIIGQVSVSANQSERGPFMLKNE